MSSWRASNSSSSSNRTPQITRRSTQQRHLQQRRHHRQQQPAEVNAVSHLKCPPFWSGNPALWFAQVEAAFALHNINGDLTRYRHIITQLPEYVRAVLAISGNLDLPTLTMQATKTTSVSAIQQPPIPQEAVAAVSARISVMADLIASVASLAKEVKSLKTEAPSRSRSSSRHRSAHAANTDNNNLCYYHARFGDNARQWERKLETRRLPTTAQQNVACTSETATRGTGF